MLYKFTEEGNLMILNSDSYLNPEENQLITDELKKILELGKKNFVVNLEANPYINSMGLSFLINLLTRVRTAGGEIVLCNISEKIEQLLILTRLRSIFTVCANLEEARKQFAK
jgi:anti-sigma B factor antagonist